MKKVILYTLMLISVFSIIGCSNPNPSPNDGIKDAITDIEEEQDKIDMVSPEPVVNKTFEMKLTDVFLDTASIGNLYGVTISVNGEMLKEEYYHNSDMNQDHNVYSVTKSISSILVGIAIDHNFIENVDQSIGDFIDLNHYTNKEELEEITIEHLLTMSAGLIWDSSNLSSEMINLRKDENPLSSILGRELGFTPGTRFNYSDGSAHLLSIILSEATDMTTLEFAKEYLFEPLEIEINTWNTDTLGTPIGGCDLFLTNREMNKIASLILNNGMYDETQIVSEEWITTSTSKQMSLMSTLNYGYYWWLSSKDGYRLISARGWGGNQIYIIPELDIIITTVMEGWVVTSTAERQFDKIEDIVVNDLIPILINEYME